MLKATAALITACALNFATVGCEAKDSTSHPRNNIALVYAGSGACDDGNCAQNAADVAIRAGLTVQMVTPEQINSEIFKGAKVWIQPGGDAFEAIKALTPEAQTLIRNFVAGGGGYLGFCAGGYLAAREIDTGITGLGLVEGEVDDQSPGNRAPMLPMTMWNQKFRYLYFEDGPNFEIRNPARDKAVAYYPNGKVAAIKTVFGKGYVALSGPHPEAPLSWSQFYNLNDTDGADFDLAHDLLNWTIQSSAPMVRPGFSSEKEAAL